MVLILSDLLRLVLWPSQVVYPGEHSSCLRETCTLLGSVLFESSMSSSTCLDTRLIIESAVLRSPTVTTELSISPFSSTSFYFMYFGTLLMTPKFLTSAKDTPKPQESGSP